jgi:hypothetical protein
MVGVFKSIIALFKFMVGVFTFHHWLASVNREREQMVDPSPQRVRLHQLCFNPRPKKFIFAGK